MKENNFADLDANFKQEQRSGSNLSYHDAFTAPFALEGAPFTDDDGVRARLPRSAAVQMKVEGVRRQSRQGAGMRVRFRTDSRKIAVRIVVEEFYSAANRAASSGFDLYSGSGSRMNFVGNRYMEKAEESWGAEWTADSDGMTDFTLYFPLFCAVRSMEIGVEAGAAVEPASPHRFRDPVVYYGSSITHCGAAARPGLIYPNIIGRILDTDFVDIGFGGACFGENPVADVIAKMNVSVFVLEYDHNASDSEFLRKTHESFFRYFRSLRPDVPVLMISKPDFADNEECRLRRAVVARTWLNALEGGDRLVEFIDGETFFAGADRADCTQDGCHPNDYGERLIAERMADRLERMLLAREKRIAHA